MDYLHQKQLLLNAILENTQAQTKSLEADNMDALEELISKRQALMTQVDELDQEVGEVAPESASEEAKAIKDTLGQVITIDNGNQSLMKKELKNVQGELVKIRTGRQREEHYGVEYGLYKEEGVFFDTKE